MYTLLALKTQGSDELGYLAYFESNQNIPFDIKRVYYIFCVPLHQKRGMHAHKTLQQAMWCPYGAIEIFLDNGIIQEYVLLDSPEKLLIVDKGVWRDMYWRKDDAVLCVAASDYYSEEDYIRDYDEFLEFVKKDAE